MRLVITLLFILVTLAGFSQQDHISWSEDVRLSWTAFKARPDRNSAYAAMSAVGIYYKYQAFSQGNSVKVKFEIDTRFDKTKSWSRRHQQSDYILKHEQLHFDICELVKRQFKKEVETTTFSSRYKSEIKEIFDKYSSFLQSLQQKYDEQTMHSKNKQKQRSWDNFIKQELLKQ